MHALTHFDSDGVISLAVLMRAVGKVPARFTSPSRVLGDICRLVPGHYDEELFIMDLSGSEIAVKASSLFKKATWLDHHEWGVEEPPGNVELVVDPASPSAAKVVADYFGIEDDLIEIANQIDTNSVRDEAAGDFRMLISYIRQRLEGPQVGPALYQIALRLSDGGIEEVLEENREKIEEFKKWAEGIEERVLRSTKVLVVEGLKIALYETMDGLPVFLVYDALKRHKEAPFDLIVVSIYRVRGGRISTKLEFRTMKDHNLLPLSRLFGGGGHRRAAGASIDGPLELDVLVNAVKGLLAR